MRTPRIYQLWGVWVAVVVLGVAVPAQAFYWVGWPGSGTKSDKSIIPPGVNHPTAPTPEANPTPIPPGGPTIPNPGPIGSPSPEPATGIAGLIGVAVLVARRRLRRSGAGES